MNRYFTYFFVGLLVIVFLIYMFTYQVRYNEVAVVTWFGKAKPPAKDEQTGELKRDAAGNLVDPGSLKVEAGLDFKLPWPFQEVHKYPKTLQLFEDTLGELQTADKHSVIVQTFVGWRIEDSYAFFQTVKDRETAVSRIKPLVRELQGIISTYRFDELVNEDREKLKLAEIEQKCTEALRAQLAEQNYGIAIDSFGIRRLVLPEATTELVFAKMRTTRQRLAQSARSEGEEEANRITTKADAARTTILAFAERRAKEIRALGEREAAGVYDVFAQDEQFASFLNYIKSMEETLSNNTQFILNSKSVIDFLRGPDAVGVTEQQP